MSDSAIRVDSDVPLPSKSVGGITQVKYPWASMKVGDSFVFPAHSSGIKATQRRAFAAAFGRVKAHGGRYTTRQVEENGEHVVRIWRTA